VVGALLAAVLIGLARQSATQLIPFIPGLRFDARAMAFALGTDCARKQSPRDNQLRHLTSSTLFNKVRRPMMRVKRRHSSEDID
jgi:hypothetical protein